MPFCQKCGTEIPSLDQPCPQCGFKKEDSPLVEESQPASDSQSLPANEEAPRGKRTRPLLISLIVVVVLALVGAGIFLAGGGSAKLGSTRGSATSPTVNFTDSTSASAKSSDSIEGRWSGTILEVDGEQAFLDPGDMDAVFKSDGTWLLTMNGKTNEGTWEVYVDDKNNFDGYQFRVQGRNWLAAITEEYGSTILVAMSTDESRSMAFAR